MILSQELLPLVGEALLLKARKKAWRLLAACVTPTHAHLQIELVGDYAFALTAMGSLKQALSHAVRLQLPGRVWAEGGVPIAVENGEHHVELYDYILGHEQEGAWVWSYQAGPIWWEWEESGASAKTPHPTAYRPVKRRRRKERHPCARSPGG